MRGFRRGKHNATLFHTAQSDVRMSVRGKDGVCLSDEDGLHHVDPFSNQKYTAKDQGTRGFKDSDAKRLLFLYRVFRVGTDQVGLFLEIEPFHSSSGNLDATRTPRQ